MLSKRDRRQNECTTRKTHDDVFLTVSLHTTDKEIRERYCTHQHTTTIKVYLQSSTTIPRQTVIIKLEQRIKEGKSHH